MSRVCSQAENESIGKHLEEEGKSYITSFSSSNFWNCLENNGSHGGCYVQMTITAAAMFK